MFLHRKSSKDIKYVHQGVCTGVFCETGHLGWSCECGCALAPIFVPHLGFKLTKRLLGLRTLNVLGRTVLKDPGL